MNIKRYLVKNMKEALYLIKKDLGPDAIIVSSHKVREKGIKGFFLPGKIEVTAVLEKNEADEVKEELGQIKNILNGFPYRPAEEHTADIMIAPATDLLNKIRQCFLDMEVDPQVVDLMLKDIDLPSRNRDEIRAKIQDRLISMFKPLTPKNEKTKIMAFVGAPGVGKTTTLAKIGAIYSLFNSFRIGFITIDTYRVGAVEQMRIYGDIIGASVDVVTSPDELKEAVIRNSDKDLILIDTAGRPSKNHYQLVEIRAFLETLDFIDIYLVMNATTKKKDMMRILKDFKIIKYSQMIITKVDETESLGSIINAAYFTGLPIAYITNGQDVPDDIEVANPRLLASCIMRDVVF